MQKGDKNEKYQKRKLNQEREKEQRLKDKQTKNNLISAISQFNPKQFTKFMQGPYLELDGKQKAFAEKQILKKVRKMSAQYYNQQIKNKIEHFLESKGVKVNQHDINRLLDTRYSFIGAEGFSAKKAEAWLFKTGYKPVWDNRHTDADAVTLLTIDTTNGSKKVILNTPQEYRLPTVRPDKIIKFLEDFEDFKQRMEESKAYCR